MNVVFTKVHVYLCVCVYISHFLFLYFLFLTSCFIGWPVLSKSLGGVRSKVISCTTFTGHAPPQREKGSITQHIKLCVFVVTAAVNREGIISSPL